MKKLCLFIVFIAMLVGAAPDAHAAAEAYFKATNIPGDSLRELWKDYTAVFGYNHEVIAPIDVATGQATGKRQHRPFKILKEVSRNSPGFEQALVKGATLPSAELRIIKTNPAGEEFVAYIYRFTNVRIISIRDWMPNSLESSDPGAPYRQEVAFTYTGIEWESTESRTIASDSWTNQ